MSQVELIYDKSNLREFCLLETQGSLETDEPSGLQGQQRFGEIERNADGSVRMIIGVHRVHGSVVKLKNPLAVLRKRQADGQATSDVRYDVQAIIKEKFMFKTRPDVVLQQEIRSLPTV
ncbi:hypothetical protein GQ54DRAFT_304536 [Martensiomyces pterosporus]|nr:hypothetical protein GQ54DRAFT_304536 [Martensiomyces pterosporus]